jgi:hypothetical protein
MDTTTALQVAAQVAKLTELTTVFQVRCNFPSRLTDSTTADMDDLYQMIQHQQFAIARLLDDEALADPLLHESMWWQTQAMLDPQTVAELAQEANQLIACCAQVEADPHSRLVYPASYSQAVIAGLLHPDVRQTALNSLQARHMPSIFSRN